MSWSLVTIVILSLPFPKALEVNLKSGAQENVLAEIVQAVGEESIEGERKGGYIVIPSGINCDTDFCDYGVGVARDALKEAAEVKVQVLESSALELPATNRPIGNAVRVEIPFSAINLATEKFVSLYILTQPFEGEYEVTKQVLVDVGLTLGNGTEHSWSDFYAPGFPTLISASRIQNVLKQYPDLEVPEFLTLTLLPYDSTSIQGQESNE